MRSAEARGRRLSWTVAAGLLALASTAALVAGITGQREASELAPAVQRSDTAFDAGGGEAEPDEPATRGPLLPESRPVAVRIPAIDAESPSLVELGLDTDGTMQVPQDYDLAGWYVHGPTPGELGPAVVVGHIDSVSDGPAVFFRLAELRPGDEVLVDRADGSTAVFVIDRVEQHPKDAFPTDAVYGNTDHAALRLITCGGSFDDSTGHYRDNIVAFGHLLGAR